jgi:hypothetical protein
MMAKPPPDGTPRTDEPPAARIATALPPNFMAKKFSEGPAPNSEIPKFWEPVAYTYGWAGISNRRGYSERHSGGLF